MIVLALSLLLSAEPHAALRWEDVEPINPPLGSLEEAVSVEPPTGLPGTELTTTVQYPGCPVKQVLWLQRFALNAALAASKIATWVEQPLPEPVLQRREVLTQAILAIRQSAPAARKSCVGLGEGWKTSPLKTRDVAQCNAQTRARTSWFSVPEARPVRYSAVVHHAPPAVGSKEPCRPRMSATLFDDAGVARIRYHTDFQNHVSAELLGDGCWNVLFTLDEATQVFQPRPLRKKRCESGLKSRR